MRSNTWVRSLDYLIESCWLLALVAVPIFFDTMTARIFEPDKIVLFRNIVLVMVVAVLVRGVIAAPAALSRTRSADTGDTAPWWRRELRRRPMLLPVIIFGIVYSAATATSVLPGISFWGSYDRLQGLYTWLNYIAFFAIIAYSLRSWSQIERIVSALVFASVPVALYGIIQHLNLDPVLWGAPTNVRVASTLGNAIFLGAYLLMCMPFTAYRLFRAVERWLNPDPVQQQAAARARERARARGEVEITFGVPPIVSVVLYGLILVLCFAALYFSGSRGPYYGFTAAAFTIGLPITVRTNRPGPALASIALAIVLFLYPQIASSLSPLIATLLLVACVVFIIAYLAVPSLRKTLPFAVGGVALVVAMFAFPQALSASGPSSSSAADATHLSDFSGQGTSEVRFYIWQGSLGLIQERPLLGWGPETMIYVYSKYYPSGLGHIERANAAPDRNHDEEMDFLVFSGVLGLLSWFGVLGTFAVVGVRALLRAHSRRAILLLAAIAAAVVGHLVEGLVGIGVVSTLMLLWTMFALATALYARPELLGEAALEPAAAPDASAAAVQGGQGPNRPARASDRPGQDRSGQGRQGQGRSGQDRPGRGRPAPTPARSGLDHMSGRQQGALLGLIVLALVAFIGGGALFWNNVQVVRADADYKAGQGNDTVGSACLTRAADPTAPEAAQCPVQPGVTAQQIATFAGNTLIPAAINNYQQAISEQPSQDMYYLWLGKTYLDEARYYQLLRNLPTAFTYFQQAENTLLQARALNPYNADHPMNLGRMFGGWAQYDPSKWTQADYYYGIATRLARHNGRWSDEWARADLLQANTRPGLTSAQRTAIIRQALAAAQHACSVDDLLGDARILRGQAELALGMNAQAAASFREAFTIGGFEQATSFQDALKGLVSALYATHDYAALLKPMSFKPQLDTFVSPMTLAYDQSIGLTTSPYSVTLAQISTTLRQKGLLK